MGGLLYFLHFFILVCSFLYVMCKVSPDCDLIMLPAADKKTVWSIFNQELLERAISVPQLPYFCKVWRTDEHCRKLKIRKWLRFAKCTTCIDFRKRRSEAKTTTEKDVALVLTSRVLVLYMNLMTESGAPIKLVTVIICSLSQTYKYQ